MQRHQTEKRKANGRIKKLKSGKKESDHKSRKDWSKKIEHGSERSQTRRSQRNKRLSEKGQE